MEFRIGQIFPSRNTTVFEGVFQPIWEGEGTAFFCDGLRDIVDNTQEGRVCFRDVRHFLRRGTHKKGKVLVWCEV